MSKNKSLVANFGAISTSPVAAPAVQQQPRETATTPARPLSRVGAGIIGAAQRSLTDIREERDRLLEQVARGGGILELDAALIDPSPFPDRLPDDSRAAFEAFRKTLAEEGQKVPIQVRAHPTESGRYQVVYGHRRWRAMQELGLPVKAILMDLTDAELVVAQGIENAQRQDLSWIERALFVRQMDQADVKPRDIRAALSIDDPELARLRSVVKAVPPDIIEAIGRAPKAGRPRWLALSAAIGADGKAAGRVRQTLSADKVWDSDERFGAALAAAIAAPVKKPDELAWRSPAGAIRGRAVFDRKGILLQLEKGDGKAFAEFVREELPALMEKFAARAGGS